MSELKRYFMAGDDFEAIPDATGKWVRYDAAKYELAALREELAKTEELSVTNVLLDIVPGKDGEGYEVFAASIAQVCEKLGELSLENETLQDRLTAAEQRNAELVELLHKARRSIDPSCAGKPLRGELDAALRTKPTESGASDKCVSDGGTCGLGGQCAECPHKESGASE